MRVPTSNRSMRKTRNQRTNTPTDRRQPTANGIIAKMTMPSTRRPVRAARLPLLISLAVSATFARPGAAAINETAFAVNALGGTRSVATTTTTTAATNEKKMMAAHFDPEYPGTAVERMMNVRSRVKELTPEELNGSWDDVRRRILWAGGLKDLPDSIPGQGYTGHSFNDFNHVDLTCMSDGASDNENDGSVRGISIGNRLGNGIRAASLPELGPGGSWSTCALGCNKDPPSDVAHVQFRARVAFKMVWAPPNFGTFVLVDDDGTELARGTPKGALPMLRERQANYSIVRGSKYSKVVDAIAAATS